MIDSDHRLHRLHRLLFCDLGRRSVFNPTVRSEYAGRQAISALVTDIYPSPVFSGYSSGNMLRVRKAAGVGRDSQIEICVITGYGWISVTGVEQEAAR